MVRSERLRRVLYSSSRLDSKSYAIAECKSPPSRGALEGASRR